MKVYIWGTGYFAKKCLSDLDDSIEILGFIESNPEQEKIFQGYKVIAGADIDSLNYDFLILANICYEEIIKIYKLELSKVVIYPREVLDINGKIRLSRKYDNPISLFKSDVRIDNVDKRREGAPYISFQMEDINWIFDSNEYLMPTEMLMNNEVYSREEMVFFNEFISEKGAFLDIGANVGTTSIYFKRF